MKAYFFQSLSLLPCALQDNDALCKLLKIAQTRDSMYTGFKTSQKAYIELQSYVKPDWSLTSNERTLLSWTFTSNERVNMFCLKVDSFRFQCRPKLPIALYMLAAIQQAALLYEVITPINKIAMPMVFLFSYLHTSNSACIDYTLIKSIIFEMQMYLNTYVCIFVMIFHRIIFLLLHCKNNYTLYLQFG